jgi:hypothetical protein
MSDGGSNFRRLPKDIYITPEEVEVGVSAQQILKTGIHLDLKFRRHKKTIPMNDMIFFINLR